MKDKSIWISLCIFLIAICTFWYGFTNMSSSSYQEDLERVESSLRRGIVECYSVEGKYPESIEYLEQNYGIYVNKDQYLIHYEYMGANLYPDFMVYLKGESYE